MKFIENVMYGVKGSFTEAHKSFPMQESVHNLCEVQDLSFLFKSVLDTIALSVFQFISFVSKLNFSSLL